MGGVTCSHQLQIPNEPPKELKISLQPAADSSGPEDDDSDLFPKEDDDGADEGDQAEQLAEGVEVVPRRDGGEDVAPPPGPPSRVEEGKVNSIISPVGTCPASGSIHWPQSSR